jgi:hypothetical protein
VDEAEDGGCAADAEAEREDRKRREAWLLIESPPPVANVLPEAFHAALDAETGLIVVSFEL